MSKKSEPVYDYGMRDMTKWPREELYAEVLSDQALAVNVICKFDWVMGAFMSTLENDFRFGKKRMRKLLKGVQRRFNYYNQWPGSGLEFDKYLEWYGFKYFIHGGKILLRDLDAPQKEYIDYLSTDLRMLADKIEKGKSLDDLSDRERDALEALQEIMPLEESSKDKN